MKKAILFLAAAAFFASCSNSANTEQRLKDSLDSVANAQKQNIDSMAQEKKENVEEKIEAQKEMVDSMNPGHDTTGHN